MMFFYHRSLLIIKFKIRYFFEVFHMIFVIVQLFLYICSRFWKDARVAEEARLESACTPKGYPGFESLSFRRKQSKPPSGGLLVLHCLQSTLLCIRK